MFRTGSRVRLAALCLLPALLAAAPAAGDVEAEPEADIEARLARMGLALPQVRPPVANYVRAVTSGDLVFLAGHGPALPDGGYVTGRLGEDLTVEQGYQAARLTALALLASLREEIGDLDRVRRIVRVFGMVSSTPGFTDQPAVINGASDLLVELFGPERGKHARAAVGMVSLPIGIAVEIEMVVEVAPAGEAPGEAPAAARPAPGLSPAMARLAFLVGEWEGIAKVRRGPGEPHEVRMVETIAPEAGGRVLEVRGIGRTGTPGSAQEEISHDAYAIIAFDEEAGRYRFHVFTAGRPPTVADMEVGEEEVVWGFDIPQGGRVRYTIRLDQEGRWHEIGELSRDGGDSWIEFFEMRLARKE